MAEYYTPTIDEFVQGFEFEYYDSSSYRMVLLDFSSNNKPKELTPSKEIGWVNRIVNWKHVNSERIIEKYKDDANNDCTIEFSGATLNWFNAMYHRDIQKLIEDGKIRCKCK